MSETKYLVTSRLPQSPTFDVSICYEELLRVPHIVVPLHTERVLGKAHHEVILVYENEKQKEKTNKKKRKEVYLCQVALE